MAMTLGEGLKYFREQKNISKETLSNALKDEYWSLFQVGVFRGLYKTFEDVPETLYSIDRIEGEESGTDNTVITTEVYKRVLGFSREELNVLTGSEEQVK